MTLLDTHTRSDAFLEVIGRMATFAFQPIVDINTGVCFGFEALLRNVDRLGFSSIPDLFDYAWNAGILHRVDMILREMAIAQFARTPVCKGKKLFYNIDGRIFESRDYHPHQTVKILRRFGLPPESLVLELPEKYDNASAQNLADTLYTCRQHNYQLAIDDFGRGFSELKMLYEHQPDYIKIDRFFIAGIADDSKKRLFVSSIVNLAHVLGTRVLAEGVETEREFLACKAIGCDLIQGFFVAKPTVDHSALLHAYAIVPETNNRDRRRRDTDEFLIRDFVEPLATLCIDDDMEIVFEAFRLNKAQTLFPVVGGDGTPLGLVREGDLKDFIYLQYGRDLLQNKVFGKSLKDFLTRCPLVDVNTDVGKILETYAVARHTDGLIVTNNFRYIGFLSADALLRIVNEKMLTQARDQNPLSNLPGNNSVTDRIAHGINDCDVVQSFVYFDFNDFKPFNDTFGFRQGDRAITLFADLLRRETRELDPFLGHIGGDDFFVGFRDVPHTHVETVVQRIVDHFAQDVECLYPAEAREARTIRARGRNGDWTEFPLLSVCAAVIHIAVSEEPLAMEGVLGKIATGKSDAKRHPDRISVTRLAACDRAA